MALSIDCYPLERRGSAMGDDFGSLLQEWAVSPGPAATRRQDEADAFFDELLLAPSPRGGAAPPPVDDSSSGGTLSATEGLAQQHQQQQQLQQQQLQQQAMAALQAYGSHSAIDPSGSAHPVPPLSLAVLQAGPDQYQFSLAQVAAQVGGGGAYVQHGAGGTAALPTMSPSLSGMLPTNSGQCGPAPSASDAGGEGGAKKRRGPRPRVFKKHACQCDGCPVDLSALSFYLQRNHICPDHLKADSYLVKGVPSRFCQRCGQGHALTEFEGSKRSCRKALERHNQRRRDKQAASTATGPSTATPSEPGALGAAGPSQLHAFDAQQQLQQEQADAMVGSWLDGAFADAAVQQEQPASAADGGQAPASFTSLQQQQPTQQLLPPMHQQGSNAMATSGSVTLPPSWAQQQVSPALQQAQQYQPSSLGPARQQAQQAQPAPQQQAQEWVMLPRELLEQQAPHLLPATVTVGAGPPAWQPASQPSPAPQLPPLQHQHQQQRSQQQHQQQRSQQQQSQQQQPQVLFAEPKPEPEGFNLLDTTVSYLLYGDEFGGSGI